MASPKTSFKHNGMPPRQPNKSASGPSRAATPGKHAPQAHGHQSSNLAAAQKALKGSKP